MTLYVEMLADGTVPLDFAVSRNRPFTLKGSYVRTYELEQDYEELPTTEYHAWAIPDEDNLGVGSTVFVMVAWEETSGFNAEVHPDFVSAYGAGLDACGALDRDRRFAPQSAHFYTGPGEVTENTRHWWIVGDRMTEDDDGAIYGHVVEVPVR